MTFNPIGIAIPFFMLLIGIEWLVSIRMNKKVYRLNDAVADLGCGIGDQMLGLLVKTGLVFVYILIYDNFRLFDLMQTPWLAWTVAIVGVDFFYYWYHRFSHRTQVGWATHVVHHQSEEYNLAVALRQPWFAKIYSWSFYLVLPLIGLPVELYVTSFAFNLLYQFWIHTRLIKTLGPFEWVFNTPSHHRVHHGINREYLDKNYGGILIIWDRMFGTFEQEVEEPIYGTLAPIRSWNPFWVNSWPLLKLIRDSFRQKALSDKLTLWLRPPGWSAEEGRVIFVDEFPPPGRNYDSDLERRLTWYVLVQFAPISVLVSGLLLVRGFWSSTVVNSAVGFIFLTLVVISGLYDQRSWAGMLEYLRLFVLIALGAILTQVDGFSPIYGTLAMGLGLVSLLSFAMISRGPRKRVISDS